MISALILLAQSQKVTLDLPVSPLPVVLQKLGEKVGEKLVCKGGTNDDFVFVSVKDVDKEVLLERIASVCEAKWVREPNGERSLTAAPTSDDPFRDEFLTTLNLFMKRISTTVMPSDAEVKALAEDFSKKNPNSMIWKEQQAIIHRTPGSSALRSIIKLIGESELKKMKDGERIVWNLNPNRTQRMLPNGSRELLARHAAQSRALQDALKESGVITDQFVGFTETLRPIVGADKIVDFMFAAVRERQGITFELNGLDSEGRFACRVQENSAKFYYELDQKDLTKPYNTLAQFSQPLAVSQENREIAEMVHEAKGQVLTARPWNPKPQLVSRFTDIDKFEPLTGFIGDAMKQVAGLKGNVVALVPDSYLPPISPIPPNANPPGLGETLANHFLSITVPTAEPKIVEKDGIWSIAPYSVAGSRARRLPRKSGAVCLRGLRDPKQDPLDVLADFSKTIKSYGPLEYLGALIDWTSTNGFSTIGSDWDGVRFYADMSQAARDAARNGGSVLPRVGLSQAQKDIINKVVYSSMAVAMPGAERGPNVFYLGGGVREDPTYVFPNGVPLDFPLLFKVGKATTLYGVATRAQEWGVRKTDFDELVRATVDKEKGFFVSSEPQDRFKYSTTLTAHLRIGSDKTPHQNLFFTSETMNLASPWMTLDTLPADVKKSFEDQLAKRREMLKGVNGGGGGGGVIPPN